MNRGKCPRPLGGPVEWGGVVAAPYPATRYPANANAAAAIGGGGFFRSGAQIGAGAEPRVS